MHWEGYSEFGLLISGEALDHFIKKYNQAHPDNDELEDASEIEAYEKMDGCKRPFMSVYLGSDFEGISLLPISGRGWFPESEGLLVLAEKTNSANQILKHGFYSSEEEICEEFRDKVGDYLPADFDYGRYIGDVTYALYA